MIKIKEGEIDKDKVKPSPSTTGIIHVTLETNEEKTFDNYPIIIKSKDISHLIFNIQIPTKTKTHSGEKGGIMDIVKEKAKHVKDKAVDTAKDVAEETKGTTNQPSSSPNQERVNEEGHSDTEIGRIDDPLISRK
ncbi:MAG: hypothetical protein ABJB73_07160 [Candidatus Nitrosocosmicus sp.]